MENQGEKKPTYAPQGWMLKKRHIDINGDVYEKAKFIGTVEELQALGESIAMPGEEPPKKEAPKEETKVVESSGVSEEVVQELAKNNALLTRVVEAFVSSQTDKGKSDIAELVEMLNQTKVAERGFTTKYAVGEIPREDLFEDGKEVIFYAPGISYVLADKPNEVGVPEMNPYKKIIAFKHAGSKKVKDQDQERLNAYCMFVSRSKKEVAWLRTHPMYNLKFFERSSKALESNMEIGQKAAEIYQSIIQWDPSRIIREAEGFGIKVDKSINIQDVAKEVAYAKVVGLLDEQKKHKDDVAMRGTIEGLLGK